MPIIKVGDKRIKFPDSMGQDEIKAVLDKQFAQPQQQAPTDPLVGLPPEVLAGIEERHPMTQSGPTSSMMMGAAGSMFAPGLPRDIAAGQSELAIMEARRKEAEFEQLRLQNPALAEMIESMTPREQIGTGIAAGTRTLGRGAAGLVGVEAFQDEPIVKQALEATGKKHGLFKVGEAIGESAPLAVLGPGAQAASRALQLGQRGRVATSAALGGLEGGAVAKGKGKEGLDVAAMSVFGGSLGAASELVLPFLNRSGSGKIKEVLGKDPTQKPIGPDGEPSQELMSALQKDDKTFKEFTDEVIDGMPDKQKQEVLASIPEGSKGAPLLTPEETQRKEAFEFFGATGTPAQIKRDPELFAEQADAFASGTGEVRAALARQDEILHSGATRKGESLGGKTGRMVESVTGSIKDKATQNEQVIGDLYKEARALAPDAKNVKFNQAASILSDLAPSDTLSGGVIEALRGNMLRMGVIDKSFKPVGRVSVEQAEELRKIANRIGANVTSGEGKFAIREFKKALDNDVFSSAGKDFFDKARASKAEFERGLSAQKRDKFDKREVSLVRDILDGAISEDVLAKRVVTAGAKYGGKEVKELKDYLLSGTEGQIAQGMQAWNDVRAEAFESIMKKAFIGGENELGAKGLSSTQLERAITAMGPDKMKVFFNKSEREFIDKLREVAKLKTPTAGIAVQPSGRAIKLLQASLSKMSLVGGEIANKAIMTTMSAQREKRVLKLVDSLEEIAKREEIEKLSRLRAAKRREAKASRARKSAIGKAVTIAPTTALSTKSAAEEEE